MKKHDFVTCFGNHGDFCKTHGKHCNSMNNSPLLTQVLNEFREKFTISLYDESSGFIPEEKVELLQGIDIRDIEFFLSQVIGKAERETRKKVTEELTSNALMKHNPDFQGRALPKK